MWAFAKKLRQPPARLFARRGRSDVNCFTSWARFRFARTTVCFASRPDVVATDQSFEVGSTAVFADWTAVQNAMSASGADVVITLDATDTIRLVGTTLASMTQSDFLFVQ